jgi:hypothetical protein
VIARTNRKGTPTRPRRIEDIAYFGSHSVYHVRLPSGAKVLANFANSQRWASDGLTWGDVGALARQRRRGADLMSAAGLKRWLPGLRATVIGIPYLWLLLFFAVPFLIVLMISFSLSRVGSPPYTWLLQYADGGFSLKLNLGNYLALFRDSIYAPPS